MLDIGGIIGRMVLDITGWTASMEKAKDDLNKFGTFCKQNAEAIKDLGEKMALAGGIIVGSLTAMAVKTLNTADSLQEMSQRTGMTAKTLSELGYAAKLSGSSLEGMESTVKKMQVNIVKAAEGNAGLRKTFDDLGIKLTDLVRMNPDQQFMSLAEAVANVKDPTTKAATAVELFGKQGTALLPMLADGKKGLDDMRDAADKAGVVMSNETAKSAADLNDKVDAMKQSFAGITLQLGTALLPIVEKVTAVITNITQKFIAWSKEHPILSGFIMNVTAAIGGIMLVLGSLLLILPKIIAGMGAMSALFAKMPAGIGTAVIALTAAVVASKLLAAAFDMIGAAYDKAMNEISNSISKETAALRTLNDYKNKATPEEIARINAMIKAKRLEGATWQDATDETLAAMRKESAGFQAWEKAAVDANKTVGLSVDELAGVKEARAKEAQEKAAFALHLEVQEIQQAAELKLLYENNVSDQLALIKDSTAMRDKTRMANVQQYWKQIEAQKEQLTIKQFATQKKRVEAEYNFEKAEINANVKDTAQKLLLLDALEANYRKKQELADIADKRKAKERSDRAMSQWVQGMNNAVNTVQNLMSNYYQMQGQRLDQEYETRRKWIEENITDETTRNKMLADLDTEMNKKKAQNARSAAIVDKAAGVAAIIVNTAQAVSKALTAGPIAGPILAILIGALGAAQLAIALKTPLPAAAQGGITTGMGPVLLGDNPSGREMIVPLERADEMGFGGGSGKTININIMTLDPRGLKEIARRDLVPILEELIRTEHFKVNMA